MKKELKWTFDIIEIPLHNDPAQIFACSTLGFANCYFTRPLYDEKADETSATETTGTHDSSSR